MPAGLPRPSAFLSPENPIDGTVLATAVNDGGGWVLAEALTALAAAAGTAVVQAAGTDAWTGFRSEVARWFGGRDALREESALERLDQAAAALKAAGPGEAERVRARQEAVW